MFARRALVLPTLLAALVASGCAVAGAGAFAGMPGSTNGNPVNPAGSPGASQPTNGSSANKAAVNVTTNTDSMIIQVKKASKVMGTVTYADGTKDGNIALSSTDNTIVSVNPTNGEISGVAPGTATVQVKSASDPTKFANITVTVRAGVVEDLAASITPKTAKIGIGETAQLDASITNSDTQSSPNGSWKSSNEQVAYVNDEGLVTGRKAGTATITFTSDSDSTVKATAKITVGADDEAEAE